MSEETGREVKRLYRSRKDKVLGGVCGGLAEYLEIDPTVVRLLWGISIFIFGFGFLLYIIALFIIPNNPHHPVPETPAKEEKAEQADQPKADWNLVIGIVLLVLGALFLLRQFDFFDLRFFHFNFFPWRLFWPLALIGIGVYLLASGATVGRVVQDVRRSATASRLRKSGTDKMIFGVCGGIGRAFEIDPTIVRVLWVVAALFSGGVFVLLYFVLALLLPSDYSEESAGEPRAEKKPDNAHGSV